MAMTDSCANPLQPCLPMAQTDAPTTVHRTKFAELAIAQILERCDTCQPPEMAGATMPRDRFLLPGEQCSRGQGPSSKGRAEKS